MVQRTRFPGSICCHTVRVENGFTVFSVSVSDSLELKSSSLVLSGPVEGTYGEVVIKNQKKAERRTGNDDDDDLHSVS